MRPSHALRVSMRKLARSAAPRGRAGSRSQAGFTMAEMVLSLAVFSAVFAAIVSLLAFGARFSRVHLHVAQMQQSLRIGHARMVRDLRMAGRGGLPAAQFPAPPGFAGRLLPDGVALEVANNVVAGTTLGDCACAKVVEGTDVLTIRGVFGSPIYQVNPTGSDFQLLSSETGRLVLRNRSPTGVPQSLLPVAEAIVATQAGNPEPLLLVSPLTDELYAIVEIDPASSFSPLDDPEIATIEFRITGGTHTDAYAALSPGGGFPAAMTTIAYVGILEEHRFYVREVRAIPGDASSDLMPRLSRARLYPGTEAAHGGGNSSLHADMASNIIDLQISLGIDTVPLDEAVVEGEVSGPSDEWLFNDPSDDPSEPRWNNDQSQPARLYYVRLSTLARTDRPDPKYRAPLLTAIEDKDYQHDYPIYNSAVWRMHRWQMLQTVVDLRNLS